MTIFWHGGSSFELTHKKMSVLLNPGLKANLASTKAVIYDRTEADQAAPEGVLLVNWPGEYDRAGFVFRGVETHHKSGHCISYVFHSSQGDIAWLGEMKEYPSEEFIEELGEAHVLIVPVGGKDVLNARDAYRLVEAVEPLVVIPMCYGDKREGLSAFLKEMDVKMPEAKKSFDVKRGMGTEEQQMELVVLEPSS